MPVDYTFDGKSKIVHLQSVGLYTESERSQCVVRVMDDDSIPKDSHILIDISKGENVPDFAECGEIVSLLRSLLHVFGGRLAIVDGQIHRQVMNTIIVGTASQFTDRLRRFDNVADAIAWLLSM